MAVKPFKLILTKSEKDKSRIQLPREVEGTLWAECQPNLGGDYGFKGESVNLKLLWATGYVDSNHKWLVGAIENWEDCFDIYHQKINGKNEKGYNNYEDNPEQKQIIDTWLGQGGLIAMCVDGIQQLEQLAEFAVERIVFNHNGYPVYFNIKSDKAIFDYTTKLIVEAKDSSFDFNLLKHGKVPELKQFKKENSWFYIMWEEELYDDTDMLGYIRLSPVLDNEILNLEFKEGCLEKATLQGWSPPEVKGGYRSSTGGAKGQSEAEIIKERVNFVTSELKVVNLLELSEEYGNKLCPIHVDLVMSLATGSDWTNHHYVGAKPLYNELYNGNSSKVEVYEPLEVSLPKEEEQDLNDPLYLAKCVQLLNLEERTFPAEINVEFLRAQDEEWLKLFFEFCTGVLVTPQGDKVPFSKGSTRAIHTWVKLRCPDTKGLHTMTQEHLEILIADNDFKPASELAI